MFIRHDKENLLLIPFIIEFPLFSFFYTCNGLSFQFWEEIKPSKTKLSNIEKGLCLSRTVSHLLNHMKSLLTQVGLKYVCSRNYCFAVSIYFEIFPRTAFSGLLPFCDHQNCWLVISIHQEVLSVTYLFTWMLSTSCLLLAYDHTHFAI